jgi:hypothetical protein
VGFFILYLSITRVVEHITNSDNLRSAFNIYWL